MVLNALPATTALMATGATAAVISETYAEADATPRHIWLSSARKLAVTGRLILARLTVLAAPCTAI